VCPSDFVVGSPHGAECIRCEILAAAPWGCATAAAWVRIIDVSYDLAVWEGDQPTDDVVAMAEFQRLYDRYMGSAAPTEPTPRIAAYVAALLARFPDIGTEGGEDSPWATAPLMGEARGPLVYFPMVWSCCVKASAWAARLADEHGLHCFDPQWKKLRTPAPDSGSEQEVPVLPGLAAEDLTLFETRFAGHGWSNARRRRDGRQTLVSFEGAATPAARMLTGLDFNPTSFGVSVSAWIGVRHDAVSDLYSRFLRGSPGDGPTLASSLADLLPAEARVGGSAPNSRWMFTARRPAADVVDVVLDDLDWYGLPDAQPLMSLDGVIERLTTRKRHQAWDGMLATACAVAGRIDEARTALAAYAAEAARQRGPMARQSWGFVRAFAEHFHLDTSRPPFREPPNLS
jgi:hypothetical protein